MKVIKRDLTEQDFDVRRIYKVVEAATGKCNQNEVDVEKCVSIAIAKLEALGKPSVPLETIQDVVEASLMECGYYDVAKHYILYRSQRNLMRQQGFFELKNKEPIETPWGPLGYVTYKRTYARMKSDNPGDTEEFEDTIMRVLRACQNQLKIGFTNTELHDAYKFFMGLKASVAGRFLWQLGSKTVDTYGLASLQNCAFVKIDHPIRPFTWAFDMLMLGAGVGANIQKHNVEKLPAVIDSDIVVTRKDTKDADYIIPDSREGWVSFLERVLEAYFYKGKSFTYSTVLIRSAGTPIKGFGGIASGPEELCIGIHNICNLLRNKRGRKLSPTDCMDIIDIIGSIVVSGNVRRSAIIILGDPDDKEYLMAKRWDLGPIPNWRAMSNNSVVCSHIDELPEEFWDGYKGNGECYGLINLELSRKVGRLADGSKYADPTVEGYNPCLTGDTKVFTSEGIKTINELVGVPFEAYINGKEHKSTEKGFWQSGVKKVFKVTLDNGCEIKATRNHKFLTTLGWKEVQEMKPEQDAIMLSDNTGGQWSKGVGSYEEGYELGRAISNNDQDLHMFDKGSYEYSTGLLRGIFDTIGEINKDGVRIAHSNKDVVRAVQRLLLAVGICSTIRQTECIILDTENIIKFRDLLLPEKASQHPGSQNNDKFSATVSSIEDCGKEVPVYDCTIPDVHMFCANGLVSHNCAEISLSNFETCCLSEIILPNITSFEELKSVATILYRICKHSLRLHCHHEETQDIVRENSRIGVGVTGYLQCTQEQKGWLSPLYEYLREYDVGYSAKIGAPPCIKMTTTKPSGTLSLLAGVTSGCHPAIFKFFNRRIRISSANPLVELCKKHGYHCEPQLNFDGTTDSKTMVVSFPCRYPDNAVFAKNLSAIGQLEIVKELQTNWSDNSVSVTVYYHKEELDEIREWLRNNFTNNVKTISFLLHVGHGFAQAPFEEISEEQYHEMIQKVTPITQGDIANEDDTSAECAKGFCPIK